MSLDAEVGRGGELLCAAVPRAATPADGQAATLARVEACAWLRNGDGEQSARVSFNDF